MLIVFVCIASFKGVYLDNSSMTFTLTSLPFQDWNVNKKTVNSYIWQVERLLVILEKTPIPSKIMAGNSPRGIMHRNLKHF